jgi:AcrR family transcriptional regulator
MRSSAVRLKEAVRARREEERQARRRDILAAAKRIYFRKGFLAATIEDIATDARVSVGTIYLYYKSKEDLYVSLLFESMELFTAELTRILRSRRRPDRKLRNVWDFFYRFQQRNPESYRIFFLFHDPTFAAAVPRATLRRLNRTAGQNFAIAAAIVREGIQTGIYVPAAPREVVDVLWAMFMGLVHLGETRDNLRIGLASVAGLRAHAFAWFESGLRTGSAQAPGNRRRGGRSPARRNTQ